MRRYVHESTVSVSPEALYRTLTDTAGWPRWDAVLDDTTAATAIAPGARFSLKPKGGPWVAMRIEAA